MSLRESDLFQKLCLTGCQILSVATLVMSQQIAPPGCPSGSACPAGAEIRGSIFVDANFNRVRDTTESCNGQLGCNGVVVHVRSSGAGRPVVDFARTTSQQGKFSFLGLLGGTYSICEDVPSGFFSFAPCLGPFVIASGGLLDLDQINHPFANFKDDPIPATKARELGCWPNGLADDRTFAAVDPEWVPIARPVVLEGRVVTPNEKFGTGFLKVKFSDSNANGVWDPGEPVVVDENLNDRFDSGEFAYPSGPAPALNAVLSKDPLIKAANEGANGQFLVYDTNGNGVYDSGEPLIGFGTSPSPGTPLNLEQASSQATSEVAEQDTPWNHSTHDKTEDILPDSGYQHLLSSYVNQGAQHTVSHHPWMEVEWEEASDMTQNGNSDDANDMTWGSFPQFVWPSVGDRVWAAGQWIFDCGHPGSREDTFVRFETEIHPPQALVTFRLDHPSSTIPFVNKAFPLDVPDMPITGLAGIPLVEADIFVSGNGGGANDLCNHLFRNISTTLDSNPCFHSGPTVPVDTTNYVFDIYPPGTDYTQKEPNGAFHINVPTRDGSGNDVNLQYLVVDRTAEIPAHAGTFSGSQGWVTRSVDPIICLIDSTTPPPTQQETACPEVAQRPTRLRVILPFKQTKANAFASSIVLGWDDVPDNSCPATNVQMPAISPDNNRTGCAPIRDFDVELHEFRINDNAEGSLTDGDWRVFVDVGGQWRYVSGLPFEHDDDCDDGDSLARDNGKSSIVGSAEGNGSGDCFRFGRHPWKIRIQDGIPIHIALGGFDSDNLDGAFCRDSQGICDPAIPAFGCVPYIGIGGCQDDRIGTYEFDLVPPSYSLAPRASASLPTQNDPGDTAAYEALFVVREALSQLRPTTSLQVGNPSTTRPDGTIFLAPSTPLTFAINAALGSQDSVGVQYRIRRIAGPLPTFPSSFPFPMHWEHTGFTRTTTTSQFFLPAVDGVYTLQFSGQKATAFGNQTNITDTEPRHTMRLVVDTTPPIIKPPAPVTIAATNANGAKWNRSRALSEFLNGQSVTDSFDPAPIHLSPQVAGKDVGRFATVFPMGSTKVTFRAADAAGNVASANSDVTVVVGQPKLSSQLVRYGMQTKGQRFVDVQMTNTGSGNCKHVRIGRLDIHATSEQHKVEVSRIQYLGKTASLPLDLGDVAAGDSSHVIRIYYKGPESVTRFSPIISGTSENVVGAVNTYSTTAQWDDNTPRAKAAPE